MDTQDILLLFDREQRQEVTFTDSRREVTPYVVRQISQYDHDSAIIYAHFTPDEADTVIQAELAYFERLGHNLEWKVYTHDPLTDLKERLAAHGLTIEEPEALLVLDLETAPAELGQPVDPAVRRLTDPAQISELQAMKEAVWNEDFNWLARRLADDLRFHPAETAIYAAYADGQMVSSAWMFFHPNSQFASLWGGSTLPAYRGRGYYGALLAARAQEARRWGVRFLTVDASPMSRPILQKSGFQWLTTIYPCKWSSQSIAPQ